MGDTSNSLDFVVFSDDWGEHPSSCQHLFRRISKSHRVVWVNTIGMRHPSLTWVDVNKAWRKIIRMVSPRDKRRNVLGSVGDVVVLQPPMLPYTAFGPIRWFNRVAVAGVVRRALSRNSMNNPILVTTVPNSSDFVGALRESLAVYYCVDDFAEWAGLERKTIQRMERDLIAKADVFVATSDNLYERLVRSAKPTYLLPHGVDFELFASEVPEEDACLANIPPPRIGYFGLFDERSDQKLIAEVAASMPDCSFVFAGPVVVDTTSISRLPNVFFTGPIGYRNLPAFAKGLNVLFAPYVCNSLTESISPLKLKEYLATGKPVVSTPLAEVKKFDGYVFTAASASEMKASILFALSGKSDERRDKIKALLQSEDWESKANQFIAILRRQMGTKNVPGLL